MAATVRVILEFGVGNRIQTREVVIPLSESLLRDIIVPLDLPSRGADPLTAELCCSGKVQIQKVMVSRDRQTAVLSEALTRALVDIMASGDTVMGYHK